MQVQAAVVAPGRYELTAVLVRPGQVRFQGLPELPPLGRCGRSWDELERLVPRQLTGPQAPVHLICLVEVCGSDDRLQQRIDRLEELINEAQAGGLPLRVSVVAYGAHGVAWRVDDLPPEVRVWAAPGDEAIKALRGLVGRQVDDREYQRAAQLECALRLVRERLRQRRAAGDRDRGRAAGPSARARHEQADHSLPQLGGRRMAELDWLLRLPGITFGALRDPKCRGRIWEPLGRRRRGHGRRRGGHGGLRREPWPARGHADRALPGDRVGRNPTWPSRMNWAESGIAMLGPTQSGKSTFLCALRQSAAGAG